MAFTVATFIAFTVLVAVLSWWKTRDDDLSTKEGYFLAGRGLPGIVIAGSLMMTNLSAEQLVGTNGQAFAGNMSTMAWEATSAFALIVLAFVFLPKLLRGGIATIPEFFEMRYDTFTMRLFSLLFLIAYVVTMLPTILYSGAVALVKIFDLESMFGISYFSAITIICIGTGIIGMCYAVFGGLKAVAYSDTINGIGLIIGGFAIPILGIIALGKLDGGGFMAGLDHLISATPEKMNAWSAPNALPPEVPWPLLLTGMFVNNLFYWATNQSIIQRSLGGKNLAESQKGAIWAGFFKCLDVFRHRSPGHHRLPAARRRRPDGHLGRHGRRPGVSAARHEGAAQAAHGLLRGRHVRRDPVLVQLGPQLRVHHLHPQRMATHLGQDRLE